MKEECARNDAIISQLRSILSTVDSTKNAKSAKVEREPEMPAPSGSRELDLSFLTASPAAQQLRVGVAGSNTQHTPLTTNTTFILSQLPALKTMLTQLRPKLTALPKSVDTAKESKADERRDYIESRIRLHLERSGQLAVGSDGNPVVAGRKMSITEAQALEAVTGLLSQGDMKSD